MTLNRLHKLLSTLIEEGYGRREVCISKETFTHNLEGDGCTVLPICRVDTQIIEMMDGDGFADLKANGTVKDRLLVVLGGASAEFGTN